MDEREEAENIGNNVIDPCGHSTATEEHNPERMDQSWRRDKESCTNPHHGAQHRAGEAKRAEGVSHHVSSSTTDPVKSDTSSSTIKVVGFDIETTGIEEHDIVTVACVWSPTAQATCFYGDDFTPVLEMLDNATLIHTFNGIEFDLPRLAKHCGRPSIEAWVRKTVDPLYVIRYTMGFGGCVKLNELLVANGFEPKSGSGLQAIQFWNEGNRKALSSYCMDDARLTYELCETRSIAWGSQWRIHLWESRVMRFAGER